MDAAGGDKMPAPLGVTINQLHYDDLLSQPGMVPDGHHQQQQQNPPPKDDHFRPMPPPSNYSSFPDDFVTQFSPVEEEPPVVVGQKSNTSLFDSDLEELTSKFLLEEEKGQQQHHSVHFDPLALLNQAVKEEVMPKAKQRREEPEEEFPYSRSGPLLVGEKPPAAKIVSPPELDADKEREDEIPSYESPERPSPAPVPKPVPVPINRESELPDIRAGFGVPSQLKEHVQKTTNLQPEQPEFCWRTFFTETLAKNQQFMDLVYWRDWKKTAAVFVPCFILLASFTFFPFLLVLAYVGLFLLGVNLALKLFVAVAGYVHGRNKPSADATGVVAAGQQQCKPGEECRYERVVRNYLEGSPVQLDQGRTSDQAQKAVGFFNRWMQKLQDIILVKDLFASLKGALVMWLLSYLGTYLSPAAIILLTFLATFTLPKFYETYKQPIDKHYGEAVKKYKQVEGSVQQKYAQLTNRQPQPQHKKAE